MFGIKKLKEDMYMLAAKVDELRIDVAEVYAQSFDHGQDISDIYDTLKDIRADKSVKAVAKGKAKCQKKKQ